MLVCLNDHSIKLIHLIVPADPNQSLPSTQHVSFGSCCSSFQCPDALQTAWFRERSFLCGEGAFFLLFLCLLGGGGWLVLVCLV